MAITSLNLSQCLTDCFLVVLPQPDPFLPVTAIGGYDKALKRSSDLQLGHEH